MSRQVADPRSMIEAVRRGTSPRVVLHEVAQSKRTSTDGRGFLGTWAADTRRGHQAEAKFREVAAWLQATHHLSEDESAIVLDSSIGRQGADQMLDGATADRAFPRAQVMRVVTAHRRDPDAVDFDNTHWHRG